MTANPSPADVREALARVIDPANDGWIWGDVSDLGPASQAHARDRKALALDCSDRLLSALPSLGFVQAPAGWRAISEAPPQDRPFDAVVDGVTRVVRWGKTSHVPIYGFCLADQGAEDFDLCAFTWWQERPTPPAQEADHGR